MSNLLSLGVYQRYRGGDGYSEVEGEDDKG